MNTKSSAKKIAATLILFGWITSTANAGVPCINKNLIDKASDVLEVAVVDDPDRMTEKQYAEAKGVPVEDIQASLAATATIRCSNGTSTASVVGTDDVVAATGHSFVDKASTGECTGKMKRPENCTFEYVVNGEKRTRQIHHVVEAGFTCPGIIAPENDWIVLKLAKPAAGVEPYVVSPNAGDRIRDNTPVTHVAAQAADYYVPLKNGKLVKGPKHVGDCEVKFTDDPYAAPKRFVSNCDAGKGSSGGAILPRGIGNRNFLGMTIGTSETAEQLAKAMRSRDKKPNEGAFDMEHWATGHIPFNGAFYKAVLKGMEEDPVVDVSN